MEGKKSERESWIWHSFKMQNIPIVRTIFLPRPNLAGTLAVKRFSIKNCIHFVPDLKRIISTYFVFLYSYVLSESCSSVWASLFHIQFEKMGIIEFWSIALAQLLSMDALSCKYIAVFPEVEKGRNSCFLCSLFCFTIFLRRDQKETMQGHEKYLFGRNAPWFFVCLEIATDSGLTALHDCAEAKAVNRITLFSLCFYLH